MSETNRLVSIEVLRGLAALMVVWQHCWEAFIKNFDPSTNEYLLFQITSNFDFGRIGVVCFFLISGFVIPYSFKQEKGPIYKFAIRRFFRLYPAYWLSLLLAIFIAVHLKDKELSLQTILTNFSMLQTFFHEPHVQGVYWTLQAEICFYLVCALMHRYGWLNKPIFQLLACVCFLSLFCILSIIEMNFIPLDKIHIEIVYIPFFLSIMFAGTLLRNYFFTPKGNSKENLKLLLGPLLVFTLPLGILLLHYAGLDVNNQPVKFGLGHVLGLVMFLAGYRYLNTNSRVWVYLGTISYSVYLFHPIAIDLVNSAFSNFVHKYVVLHGWLGLMQYLVAITALTILISHWVFKKVESPSISIGRTLAKKAVN